MKKRKKRWFFLLETACLLMLTTVGIYATTQAKLSVKNVITVGNIEIELREQDKKGRDVSNKDVAVSRGYTVDRIVFAENTGEQPAFVRIAVNSIYLDGETGKEAETDKIEILFNEDARWIYEDGWFYYAEILEPGEKTVPLLSGAYFSTTLDESNQDDVLQLKIFMHGLQAKNNQEDVRKAVGWPEE
ncbi:MAG: hypothetical protein IJA07_04795 [Agathobacter sp.]|nr:hypothetical protein [Agathobacter sp.]